MFKERICRVCGVCKCVIKTAGIKIPALHCQLPNTAVGRQLCMPPVLCACTKYRAGVDTRPYGLVGDIAGVS